MDKTQQPSAALPDSGGQVTSPRAAAYAERVGVKKYIAPVGGVPAVSIPPLDAPYARGQTMAAQAQSGRMPSLPQGSIFGPQGANPFVQPGGPQAGRPESPQTQILPTDMLPDD